ncbi:MAG: cation transporter [Elusimicrobia bacterium]|nr:cation transporter [Elusimicrobiota bacterium]
MAEECCAEAHAPRPGSGPLRFAFVLTAAVFAAEVVGARLTGSLALLADAAHMAVDLASLGLGLFAAWAANLPRDPKRTFGYRRVEVLAALANGVGLWITVGVLLNEAWARWANPRPILVGGMLGVAAVGLCANLVSAAVLHRGARDNINLRGVLLHVLSDALGSVGVIVAGVVIWRTGWTAADALATAFVCVVIAFASWRLVRDSIHILLEGAPAHLDLEAVRLALAGVDGVLEVHDLHLWSLSAGSESMSAHLVVRAGADPQGVRRAAAKLLSERFGLSHATLQLEEPEGSTSS